MSHTALLPRSLTLLARWAGGMERWWTPCGEGQGIFGFGLGNWGVQAAWRHCAAVAVLATHDATRAEHWRGRALAGLRTLTASHISGGSTLPDGRTWGRTWISALALERAWFGIAHLTPYLTADDQHAIARMLADEADWLCTGYERVGKKEIATTRWNHDGRNHGESNVWNGCLLWRAAEMLPADPRAAAWRERAHAFLLNGISLRADVGDERIIAGKPLREWVTSAGFFDHLAFDHHGYLNVGYQVICLSNAAILHFDAREAGFARPESLDHHQADLWATVRRTVFADGRLARIGGDSRARYAYCQEYLVPAALYATDHLGDPQAIALLAGWLHTAEQEAATTSDGSFYGTRLSDLIARSPSYWLRLESDRAAALAMLVDYLPLVAAAPTAPAPQPLTGAWSEPEHGALLVRDEHRLAAFAWRAHGLAQGTCQPPGDGNLAEWEGNLVGTASFADLRPGSERRKLIAHEQAEFVGGFLTWGRLALGCGSVADEGWVAAPTGQAVHHLAFAALPDGRSVLALEVIRTGAVRALVLGASGLHLNLPNDLLNGSRRTLTTAAGEVTLAAGETDGVVSLASRWAQLAPGWSVIGLAGGTTLSLDRNRTRRGGTLRSLHVEEVQWGAWREPRFAQAGEELLAAGWLVRCGGDAADAAACAALNPLPAATSNGALHILPVRLPDGSAFILVLNPQAEPVEYEGMTEARVLAGPATWHGGTFTVAGNGAALLTL